MNSAPVRMLEEAGLGIWLSEGGGARPTIARLREHETVVRRALRESTPLPLRFGAVFTDESDVERVLEERAGEFLGTLDRLDNRVEMGLRIERAEPSGANETVRPQPAAGAGPSADAGTGRAYLEARRKVLDSAAAARKYSSTVVAEIAAEFADMELPTARSAGDGAALLGGVAHLVHREQLRRYRDRAARLQADRAELRITLTGPWAPYSFV